jgi:hypothetical protein
MDNKKQLPVDIVSKIQSIREKDPDMFRALDELMNHLYSTYSDKYQAVKVPWLDTKVLLTNHPEAKLANIHSASKYIQRYSTVGFVKSEQKIDLHKAIHYLLFECVRKSNVPKDGE